MLTVNGKPFEDLPYLGPTRCKFSLFIVIILLFLVDEYEKDTFKGTIEFNKKPMRKLQLEYQIEDALDKRLDPS